MRVSRAPVRPRRRRSRRRTRAGPGTMRVTSPSTASRAACRAIVVVGSWSGGRISSGIPAPRSAQRLWSCRTSSPSRATYTAVAVLVRIVFAYWSAWIVLRSRSSTTTSAAGRVPGPRSNGRRPTSSSACSRSYWRFKRTRTQIITGTNTITAHAPSANFVIAITTVTTAVVIAPKPLIRRPWRQPGSRSLRWRLAIPAWESVNEVNTPIA